MLDIKLKDKSIDEAKFKKYKLIINLIAIVVALLMGVLIATLIEKNLILILAIISLIYLNIILLLNIFKNNMRTLSLWKIIEETLLEIESKKYSIDKIQKRWLEDRESKAIMGTGYGKLIYGINEIIKRIKTSIENTDKNEKMNIEVVKNVTKKLDKPLNQVLEDVAALKNNSDEDTALENLKEKGNSIKKLIEELFEASKLASGDMEIEQGEIEIVSLMKQALIEFKDEAEERNLTLKVKLPDKKLFIKADGERLWRVFEIVIENTIKHSLENSRVYFEAFEEADKVYISIKNTSKKELNIKAEELIKVINSNEENSATGLGLEIAKSLVLIQGGEFEVEIDADLFKTLISFGVIKGKGEV